MIKSIVPKFKRRLGEHRQLRQNADYKVQFYNCWDQPNEDMYWNRYIKHHHWLDNKNLRVAIFSVFGRRKFIEM